MSECRLLPPLTSNFHVLGLMMLLLVRQQPSKGIFKSVSQKQRLHLLAKNKLWAGKCFHPLRATSGISAAKVIYKVVGNWNDSPGVWFARVVFFSAPSPETRVMAAYASFVFLRLFPPRLLMIQGHQIKGHCNKTATSAAHLYLNPPLSNQFWHFILPL